MTKKVLIIQHNATSHINGALKITETLKKEGYEVIYFADNKISNYVHNFGFRYFVSKTMAFAEDLDEDAIKENKIDYKYFKRLKTYVLRRVSNLRLEELSRAINQISPNVIITDTVNGSDFILLYPLLKERKIRFFLH